MAGPSPIDSRFAIRCCAAITLLFSVVRGQSSANCTFMYFDQPIDHFNGNTLGVFKQRVCVYNKFRMGEDMLFFYTGNESPVDLYVNNTGLMWDLGQRLGVVLAFAEHRYFGESVPQLRGVSNCGSYLTSAQALADYASLIPILLDRLHLSPRTKVVSFGGSYGGMLSAWFRLKYPQIVTGGAVAASAPIWGFASLHPALDGSYKAIVNGVENDAGNPDPVCHDSYLAAWALMELIGKSSHVNATSFLTRELSLCDMDHDVLTVIRGFQDVLFLLAESNFPFASDYIVFSVINKRGYSLPPWPMREACKLVRNTGVKLSGNKKRVLYDILVDGNIKVHVDWNSTSLLDHEMSDVLNSKTVKQLLNGVRDVYAMLYNITGETTCFGFQDDDTVATVAALQKDTVCQVDSMEPLTAWSIIVCNEGMNLVQDTVRGIGSDIFWPPNAPWPLPAEDQLVRNANRLGYCKNLKNQGIRGVTETHLDEFGTWDSMQYAGKDIGRYSSNIIFSNGMYDPWSAAGVLNDLSSSVVAVVLEQGGHHTDLMFSRADDPPSIVEARKKEEEIIRKWLKIPATNPIEEPI